MTASLGFGRTPWGYGGYGSPLTPPAPATLSELSTSRYLDGVTGRYVTNDEGGFDPMGDTRQRVQLLIAFALKDQPFITQRDLAEQSAAIRAALQPMTRGPEPAIRLLAVTAAQSGPTASAVTVRYIDLLTGTEQTVEPAL